MWWGADSCQMDINENEIFFLYCVKMSVFRFSSIRNLGLTVGLPRELFNHE